MAERDPQSIDQHVLAEFVRMQAAPKTWRKILGYAGRRVRMLAHAGHPVAADEASILVADAIADTLTGVVFWDHRYPFRNHLYSVIRAKTSHRLRRAKLRPHVSLDVLGDCGAFVARESIEGDRAPTRPDVLFESMHVIRKLYGAIRGRAPRDASLTALLDAYAVGFEKPCDIMHFTGLTRAELVNARKRLDRRLARIPGELRIAAIAAMRGPTLRSSICIGQSCEDEYEGDQ